MRGVSCVAASEPLPALTSSTRAELAINEARRRLISSQQLSSPRLVDEEEDTQEEEEEEANIHTD